MRHISPHVIGLASSRAAYIAALVLLLLGGVQIASAAEVANPSAAGIVEATPNAEGVFLATKQNEVQHVQSGLICPPSIAGLPLWRLAIYESPAGPGGDIGCDYGVNGSDGQWLAKLTIFAVKAGERETVDAAFTRYKADIIAAYPDAMSRGPAVTMSGEVPDALREVRSEEFDAKIRDLDHITYLIVVLKGGWILKIRGTVRTEVSKEESLDSAAGQSAPSLALVNVFRSIGATSNER